MTPGNDFPPILTHTYTSGINEFVTINFALYIPVIDVSTEVVVNYTDTSVTLDPNYDVILVRVKTCKDAYIGLLAAKNNVSHPMYEIVLGAYSNTKAVLR